MLAQSVVTQIQRMNPDWTPAQIISVINDVHNAVFKRETDQQLYLDPLTGDLPFLSTVAGTFQYAISIPGVSLWKVAEIVTDATQAPIVSDGNDLSDRERHPYVALGKRYRAVPSRRIESRGPAGPIVLFRFDPGTQTALYKIAAYEAPPVILNLGQSLLFNDNKTVTVCACVQALLDAMDNGRYLEAWAAAQSKWIPELQFDCDKDNDQIYSSNYTY